MSESESELMNKITNIVVEIFVRKSNGEWRLVTRDMEAFIRAFTVAFAAALKLEEEESSG